MGLDAGRSQICVFDFKNCKLTFLNALPSEGVGYFKESELITLTITVVSKILKRMKAIYIKWDSEDSGVLSPGL